MKFIEACNFIGNEYSLVQGTGGNASIKISSNEMLIKASGTALSDITEYNGLVKVNFPDLIKFYSNNNLSIILNKGTQIVMQSKIEKSEIRPSMETGFHSFLGKCVIHTHPSSLLLLLSIQNGKQILFNLLNKFDVLWLDYVSPGHELSYEIGKLVLGKDIKKILLFFFKTMV